MPFTPFDPFEHFESFTLKNGIRVYAGHLPTANQQVFSTVIGAGHYHGPEGLAHFTEHIVADAKGSGEGPKMRETMRALGGQWDGGSTNTHRTQYGFSIPMVHAEEIASLLTRLKTYVLDCSMEYDDALEKGIFMGEYERRKTSPEKMKIEELVYLTNNPSHYWKGVLPSAFGSEQKIKGRTLDEVKSFYERYYTPANIDIIAIGRMEAAEVKSRLNESAWGKLQMHGQKTLPMPPHTPETPLLKSHAFATSEVTTASLYAKAFIGKEYSYEAVILARYVLHRITNDILREQKGLTYGITIEDDACGDCCTLELKDNGIENKNLDATRKGLEEVWEKLEQPDFDKAVATQKKAFATRIESSETTTRDLMGKAVERKRIFGEFITNREYAQRVLAVPTEEVREILRQLSPAQAFYRWTLPVGVKPPQGVPLLDIDETLARFSPKPQEPDISL